MGVHACVRGRMQKFVCKQACHMMNHANLQICSNIVVVLLMPVSVLLYNHVHRM